MFELVRLRDGLHTIRDLETGETFHPVVGPMEEAAAIHIAPLDLANRLKGNDVFTVWDVGLGAGANAVALLEALAALPRPFCCRLVSFDLTLEPLRFAIEHADALRYPVRWLAQLTALVRFGQTTVEFSPGGRVDWQLSLGDFTSLRSAPAPDGIIYDPYSPAKNQTMWSLVHFAALRTRLTNHTVLTSYSRSTAVRVTLLLAGFYVGIGGATGEKDQTTVAATDLALLRHPLPASWLLRVRMSTSARPIGRGENGPIDATDLRTLEQHPQFAGV